MFWGSTLLTFSFPWFSVTFLSIWQIFRKRKIPGGRPTLSILYSQPPILLHSLQRMKVTFAVIVLKVTFVFQRTLLYIPWRNLYCNSRIIFKLAIVVLSSLVALVPTIERLNVLLFPVVSYFVENSWDFGAFFQVNFRCVVDTNHSQFLF